LRSTPQIGTHIKDSPYNGYLLGAVTEILRHVFQELNLLIVSFFRVMRTYTRQLQVAIDILLAYL
jgi:hypothetical protein